MTPAQTTPADPTHQALSTLITTLMEDALFVLAAGGGIASLEPTAKRRADAYNAVLGGHKLYRLTDGFDHWLVEMTRALAPICPPVWMPMHEVVREKVTLEVGARGLRALFSSKPSDKDVQRVKRLGTLAVRVLRTTFAADGAIDPEEARTLAALIGSLGLPEADAAPLYTEAPIPIEQLDVYGELEPAVARALVRGAWLAAAWDQIDPREEHVVRTLAQKIALPLPELEAARSDALARVDGRRNFGLATVDAVRFMLVDRVPGAGVQVAAQTAILVLPRRFREEALAQVGHGAPVTLAKRYAQMPGEEKQVVLAMAWCAALGEDPALSRRAIFRARHDRVAADLGEDGARVRAAVDDWLTDTLAPVAFNIK
jgi:tellurite resistance protein